MNRDRARVLARLASLEGFREEQRRQQLTAAHTAAQSARKQEQQDTDMLLALESARTSAIHAAQADMARYALFTACTDAAMERLERSMASSAEAQAEVERASRLWTEQRARKDMADDRALRAHHEVIEDLDQKQAIDTLDRWLGRETGE
jgi:hypothetical protein